MRFAPARFGLAALLLSACTQPTESQGFTIRGNRVSSAVTHVVATSMVGDTVTRVAAPVEHGAFALTVAPGRPWLVVFVDDQLVGSAKAIATFRAGTLDTLAPTAPGELDLGAVSIVAGVARSSMPDTELHDALGLDAATAATLGDLDDVALRYTNPDLDTDGVLDVDQPGMADARLDLRSDVHLVAQQRVATLSDLVAGTDSLAVQYLGASLQIHVPTAFGGFAAEDVSVTFTEPFYGAAGGPDAPPTEAGTPVTEILAGADREVGVYARGGQPTPAGEYFFQIGDHTLDFTNVHTLTTPRLQPVIRFHMAGDGSDAPDSIEFAWRRRVRRTWEPLTPAEAAILMPTCRVQVVQGSSYKDFQLPPGTASGSIPYADDGATLYVARPGQDSGYMSVTYGRPFGVETTASFAITPWQTSLHRAR